MGRCMKVIGVLYHPLRPDSCELAERVEALLRPRQVEVWRGSADDEPRLIASASGLDLLITLGGDGTIVRAVRCVAHVGVPILGVNLGRLGFLAEVEPTRVEGAIASLISGTYRVEERMMLCATLWRGDRAVMQAEAINDVVMARGRVSRTVHVSISVDGHHVMTPAADGVIVATPTGSTAYCLAAGGPIVAPDLNCFAVTPIAAHLGIAHAFVIPAHRSLRLELVRGEGASLTFDGYLDAELEPGDGVQIAASENTAKFVRFGNDGYFYETVLTRLRWPDRAPRA